VKERHPFFKPVVIPASTYRGQHRQVRTIAVDNLLVCRDDLPADLVYRLTRAVHENVGLFASIHPSGREINAEDGPSTPIPLHVGAARYYRERELFR
jgi:TRAP transporter TAXI family solute receptor